MQNKIFKVLKPGCIKSCKNIFSSDNIKTAEKPFNKDISRLCLALCFFYYSVVVGHARSFSAFLNVPLQRDSSISYINFFLFYCAILLLNRIIYVINSALMDLFIQHC